MKTPNQKENKQTPQTQQQVWNKIAEQWNKYRETPSPTVINFLKNKTGKILDLGCGSGRNFSAIPKTAEIYAIDFSQEMLEHAKKKNIAEELTLSTTDKIPYKDNFFDSIICIALLHCIPKKQHRKNTIKEIYRTLKPKSQALISVWSRSSPRLKNKSKECFIPWTTSKQSEKHIEKQERFTYIYDKEELEKEVTQAGFTIIKSWEERNLNIIAEK